jgi:hypothetical protein
MHKNNTFRLSRNKTEATNKLTLKTIDLNQDENFRMNSRRTLFDHKKKE